MYAMPAAQGSRHSVLLAHPVTDAAMARLQVFFDVETRIADTVPGHDELVGWLHGKAGIMADTRFVFDTDLVRRLPTLKAICNLDAGHGNLDLDALTRAGIRATSTPDAGSDQLAAEAAVGEAWSDIRRLLANVARAEGGEGRYSNRWSRRVLLAEPVQATQLGIVGTGSLAQALAVRAQAEGVRLLRSAPDPQAFWRSADVIVCAGGDDLSVPRITDAEVGLMKAGAWVINFSGDKILGEEVRSGTGAGARILNRDLALGQGLEPGMFNRTLVAAEDLIASLGFGRNSWHPQHLLNPDILCDSCC